MKYNTTVLVVLMMSCVGAVALARGVVRTVPVIAVAGGKTAVSGVAAAETMRAVSVGSLNLPSGASRAVVLVQQELSSTDLASSGLVQLESAVKSMPSMVYPYVWSTGEDDIVSKVMDSIPSARRVDATAAGAAAAIAAAQSGDVVVISDADEATAAAAVDALAQSKSDFVVVYTGARSELVESSDMPKTVRKAANTFEKRLGQTFGQTYTVRWYFPSAIVQGLVISAVLLFILCTGVCCTFQLQSELQFGAEKSIKEKRL